MIIEEFRVWAVKAFERFSSGQKLLESSVSDPPTEPYKSKYEAKKIFTQLLTEIEAKWENHGTMQVKILTALFKFHLGKISIETEEHSAGCDTLTATLEEIQAFEDKPECFNLSLAILNQLGCLWSGRGDLQKALEYLVKAEKLYSNYKTTTDTCPVVFEGMFGLDDVPKCDWSVVDQMFTRTLYYLAQVYEHLKENAKSAHYCRETLKRQRDEEYEANDWAINCATLSQYFLQEKMFHEARHLLSCAAFTLLKYEIEIVKDIEENQEAWNQVHQTKASISCCWLKYAINLLTESLNATEEPKEKLPLLIEEEEVAATERRIPCSVSNYDEAKTLFIFAQDHVSVASSFFTLNEYANNHAQIVQDHSKLYKGLSQHDRDLGRKCKMHKRRIDMLENLVRNLNPQFYLAVCRQLQFELGEICYEMIDLKMQTAALTDDGLDAKAAKKINSLSMKGISHFKDFLNSLKNSSDEFPLEFSEELVRPVLIAHFYLGRYYTRLIETSDLKKKLHHLSVTEECYRFIVRYTERNPHHSHHVEIELPIIKEMLELMPEKITQLAGNVMF